MHSGITLYVSKLGDNSDGSSWHKAFTNVQAALDAIPDENGGHRIIIRPDTYMESMLAPTFRGKSGAYNELIGDTDGRFGSGTKGYAIIDSSDPGRGFKSYDWYGPIRAYKHGWSDAHTEATFSAIVMLAPHFLRYFSRAAMSASSASSAIRRLLMSIPASRPSLLVRLIPLRR